MRCFRLGRPQLVGAFIAMSFVACSVIELPPAAPQEGTAQPTILEGTGEATKVDTVSSVPWSTSADSSIP